MRLLSSGFGKMKCGQDNVCLFTVNVEGRESTRENDRNGIPLYHKTGIFKHKFRQRAGALKSSGRDHVAAYFRWNFGRHDLNAPFRSRAHSFSDRVQDCSQLSKCRPLGWWREEVMPVNLWEDEKQDCQWLICLGFSKAIIFCEVEPSVFSGMQNNHKVYQLSLCQNIEIPSTHLWEKGLESSHCVRLEGIVSILPEKQ